LAADGLGVAVLDRDKNGAEAVASSITRTGGRAMAITADVTSSEQIEDAVASVCAGLGDPTVLVNNTETRLKPGARYRPRHEESLAVSTRLRAPLRFPAEFLSVH
jgi:NAD(P)-dependent dehydrogenase (short-subunit alcohol dehydrogenase family)